MSDDKPLDRAAALEHVEEKGDYYVQEHVQRLLDDNAQLLKEVSLPSRIRTVWQQLITGSVPSTARVPKKSEPAAANEAMAEEPDLLGSMLEEQALLSAQVFALRQELADVRSGRLGFGGRFLTSRTINAFILVLFLLVAGVVWRPNFTPNEVPIVVTMPPDGAQSTPGVIYGPKKVTYGIGENGERIESTTQTVTDVSGNGLPPLGPDGELKDSKATRTVHFRNSALIITTRYPMPLLSKP